MNFLFMRSKALKATHSLREIFNKFTNNDINSLDKVHLSELIKIVRN